MAQTETDDVRGFHGNSLQALDAKNRVTIPARWRFDGIDELLAVPDGANPALRLMPREVFHELLGRVQASVTLGEQDKLAIIRVTSARAFACPLDKQGRMLLPASYVESLGFSGEVMLVGAWQHVEVWVPNQWETYVGRADALLAAGAQTVGI